MATLVNLNRVRKARAQATAETRAAENRAKFGRTPAKKASDADAAARLKRALDEAKRET